MVTELTMRIRHAFVSGCVLLLLFLPAVPSWACVCAASPSFDDSTRTQKASVVVVGRVLAVGTDSEGTLHRDDPAGVDVENHVGREGACAGHARSHLEL